MNPGISWDLASLDVILPGFNRFHRILLEFNGDFIGIPYVILLEIYIYIYIILNGGFKGKSFMGEFQLPCLMWAFQMTNRSLDPGVLGGISAEGEVIHNLGGHGHFCAKWLK